MTQTRFHIPMNILVAGLPANVTVAIACEALNRGHHITVMSAGCAPIVPGVTESRTPLAAAFDPLVDVLLRHEAMIGRVPPLLTQERVVAAIRQARIRGYVAIGAPEHLLCASCPTLVEASNASFEGDAFAFELEQVRDTSWAVFRPSMVVVATRTEFAWACVRRENVRGRTWPEDAETSPILTAACAVAYPTILLDELERPNP